MRRLIPAVSPTMQGMAIRWASVLGGALEHSVRRALRPTKRSHALRPPPSSRRRRLPRLRKPASASPGPESSSRTYPGDFTGTARIEYTPAPDGRADPGEIVWGWVPFEEDPSRGKDRPTLVVAREGSWVLALMLTSKDHDQDGDEQVRSGPVWHDIGTGGWDRAGRASEVRLDRVLRLDPDAIRREGGRLDRHRFDEVAARLRTLHGWG